MGLFQHLICLTYLFDERKTIRFCEIFLLFFSVCCGVCFTINFALAQISQISNVPLLGFALELFKKALWWYVLAFIVHIKLIGGVLEL